MKKNNFLRKIAFASADYSAEALLILLTSYIQVFGFSSWHQSVLEWLHYLDGQNFRRHHRSNYWMDI